ncbi:DUF6314 family protein [Ruegeria sp. SCP11]|uniref:DUF6314 family protein n=1 Tax=Ruegeria sp. SCP11 TaxID=3141378 RepID=UPI00333D1D27
MTLPSSLSDFEGNWSLSRTIHDARAGHVAQAEGHAVLHPSDDGLIYDEEVSLHIPGQAEMKGTRRYLWRDADDWIAIHFDDERYFHALKLGQSQSRDHHDCPPDSYDAVYDFSGWPIWSVSWTVKGPRKAYEMKTEYRHR